MFLTSPSAPFRAPSVPLNVIDKIIDELGPIPHLCFGTQRFLDMHRRQLFEALGQLTLTDLENMSFTGESLALDTISHKIYMLKRLDTLTPVDSVEVDIVAISPFVASKLAARMRVLERHELVHLFERYSAIPSTRRLAGDVFTAYCHVIFSTKIKLDFFPMVRIGGQPQTKAAKDLQWFSSHTEFRGSDDSTVLEALRVKASTKKVSLRIDPSCVVDYSSDEVVDRLHVEANIYYIPINANRAGINSFILHNKKLYLFQTTISDAHIITPKLLSFLLKLKGLPPQNRWHFIFVRPPRRILACSIPDSAELRELVLYSAEVKVKS